MSEFIGECRYGQFGCDYVLIRYEGVDSDMIELIQDLADNMSGGDCDALEYAQPKLEELLNNKTITVVRLNEIKR